MIAQTNHKLQMKAVKKIPNTFISCQALRSNGAKRTTAFAV